MKRFMTWTDKVGEVHAVTEQDNWKEITDGLADDWIWQYAETAALAIASHSDKHDEWRADLDAGRPEKDTY